jgi:hypothetical protein
MHHDWSEALELSEVDGSSEPAGRFEEWCWRSVAELPARQKLDEEGEQVYAEELSGRMVRSTLVGLNAGFGLLRELLEPTLGKPSS